MEMFDIDYISMHYLHQHNLPSTQHLNNKSAIPESELFYSIEKFGVNVEYKHKYLSLSLQKTNLFVCLFVFKFCTAFFISSSKFLFFSIYS